MRVPGGLHKPEHRWNNLDSDSHLIYFDLLNATCHYRFSIFCNLSDILRGRRGAEESHCAEQTDGFLMKRLWWTPRIAPRHHTRAHNGTTWSTLYGTDHPQRTLPHTRPGPVHDLIFVNDTKWNASSGRVSILAGCEAETYHSFSKTLLSFSALAHFFVLPHSPFSLLRVCWLLNQ